jgi:2-phosphosulfolactate phosphatase
VEPRVSFVDLADARPEEAVVVIDVLRAFTTVPWLLQQGASRVLAVGSRDHARRLAACELPDALLAGEHGGRRVPDFDLGNSPHDLRGRDLGSRPVVLRTSAGTQGLVRTSGSRLLLAASFTVADATARALRSASVRRVTFVITGASLGRDGDEDLACAELIAARLHGRDPDVSPYLARVGRSDAGRVFGPGGPDWANPQDRELACQVDRFDHPLVARPAPDVDAIEIHPGPAPRRTSV